MVGAVPVFICSASRESLPTGAGRLDTGRSGVTTRTDPLPVAAAPAPPDVGTRTPPTVAAGTVTGPGSLVADDGNPTLTATVAATATTSTAKTPHTARMHPFSYRNARHDRHADAGGRAIVGSAFDTSKSPSAPRSDVRPQRRAQRSSRPSAQAASP